MSTAVKLHVKKGDTVQVLSGKDKGKEGKILTALPKKGKVIVEGVNKVKRHTKPSQTNPQGGIVTKEDVAHIAGVAEVLVLVGNHIAEVVLEQLGCVVVDGVLVLVQVQLEDVKQFLAGVVGEVDVTGKARNSQGGHH